MKQEKDSIPPPANLLEIIPPYLGMVYQPLGNMISGNIGRLRPDYIDYLYLKYGYLTTESRFFIDKYRQVRDGTDNLNSRKLEAIYYGLTIWALQQEFNHLPIHQGSDRFIEKNDDGRIIAIIDGAASLNKGPLISEYTKARQTAFLEYQTIMGSFEDMEPGIIDNLKPYISRAKNILPPVWIMDVTARQKDEVQPSYLKRKSQVRSESEFFRLALSEVSYWKSSEHLVFVGEDNQEHDYFSYAIAQAKKEGLPLSIFLEQSNLHELLHLFADEITNSRFGVFNTWYNEGFCEYFGGRLPHAKKSIANKKLSMDEIMDLDHDQSFYQYGPILIEAIGKAYNPENPDKGILMFSSRLYGNGKPVEITLKGAALELLKADNKIEDVKRLLQEQPRFPENGDSQWD